MTTFLRRALSSLLAITALPVLACGCADNADKPTRAHLREASLALPPALARLPSGVIERPTDRAPRVLAPSKAPLPPSPKRVISLAPVITETVFAAGRGEAIVGVTKYCDRPAAARDLPKIGGANAVSLERLLELKPDLVIAMSASGQRSVLDRLSDLGVPVLIAYGDTIGEVRMLISVVTEAVDSEVAATKALASFDASLEMAHRSRTPSPRVLVTVSSSPIVVAGSGTFPNQALMLLGATPQISSGAPGWPTWSLEAVAEAKVDVIVAADGKRGATTLRDALEEVSPATVVVAGDRPILMRPGPHLGEDLLVLSSLLESVKPAAPKGKARK